MIEADQEPKVAKDPGPPYDDDGTDVDGRTDDDDGTDNGTDRRTEDDDGDDGTDTTDTTDTTGPTIYIVPKFKIRHWDQNSHVKVS